MRLEILSESLRMAVDKAFFVEETDRAGIEADAEQLNVQQTHERLAEIGDSHSAGLKSQIAKAYMSGDREAIAEIQSKAHRQALQGISRTVLRRTVRSTQKNSTMRLMNTRRAR